METEERIIILPEVNPEIRNMLNSQYKLIAKQRKLSGSEEQESGLRRCNRCKLFFPIENTRLRKHKKTSLRQFRICDKCNNDLNTSIR